MKPATIRDVANRAGVGIGTVSSVLNCSRPVNEATRQKVLATIKELDYRPNPSGRHLSLGKTDTIGVIIPFFTVTSQIERLRGVMAVVGPSDYDLNLFTVETVAQRNKFFQTIPYSGQIDGLLLFYHYPTEDELQHIRQSELPTVLVDVAHPDVPHIFIDNVAAARNAVEHLIALKHRKIAYVSDYLDDPMASNFGYQCYVGYCMALEAANIPLRPEYHCQSRLDRQQARQSIVELLSLPEPPTAIFAFSDELALSVLDAACELDIPIPNSLSVVGYNDIELADFAQLTTVRQNLFEASVQGIELLLDLIDDPDTTPIQYQIPTELIVRHSTAPLAC
ncbi:MAG: LacI family DNA-binding transcriptional regulator [Anaerolineae bacterium]|nr:LacI family DNA-binding transcriptional regulator [Anaerolineae bacterium]